MWIKIVHVTPLVSFQVSGLRIRFELKLHEYGKPVYHSVHREHLQARILRDDSCPVIMEGGGFLSDHL